MTTATEMTTTINPRVPEKLWVMVHPDGRLFESIESTYRGPLFRAMEVPSYLACSSSTLAAVEATYLGERDDCEVEMIGEDDARFPGELWMLWNPCADDFLLATDGRTDTLRLACLDDATAIRIAEHQNEEFGEDDEPVAVPVRVR